MRYLLALLLFPLALVACDSGSDDGVAKGRFQATFTGAEEVRLEGAARIMRQTFPDGSMFVALTMVPDGFPSRSFSLSGEEDALSRTGTFSLGDGRGLGLVYIEVLGTGNSLISRSGSVTFTRADDDRVIGTFTATLEPFSGGAATPVEGAFDATPGSVIRF